MAKDTTTRGLRDEATVGPDPARARDLQRLSEMRYEVADGEPDIRGWHVYASTGREVGTVTDLLVDVEAGEVVMLDVDLRRNDQHTLVPIRAAWIDHGTRRVVLDARALDDAAATADGRPSDARAVDALPADTTPVGTPVAGTVPPDRVPAAIGAPPTEPPVMLPTLSRGALSDADIRRFDEDYVRTYGERGTDRDTEWRVPRGSDEALRFAPRRLLDQAGAQTPPAAPVLEESRDVNAIMREPVDASSHGPSNAAVASADAAALRTELPIEPAERRGSRVDDARALDEADAIDPRELDARVRIDEGATVDEGAPVAGVRYDGEPHTPHDYGTPDAAYGPGHGSGRIGFDRVVTREPYTPSDAPPPAPGSDAPPNAVRYRRYDDGYAGPAR